MKRFLCIVMLLSVLLSCCACGKGDAGEAAKPAGSGLSQNPTPEEQFGHIDQTVPVDGVYQIWSEVGVKNMAAHPDASFELLCNVDMGGAVLEPIGTPSKPFTGDIQGADFTISNFSVTASEGVLGFVGVNKGFIRDLRLADVTLTADESTQYVGMLAAVNESRILRCQIAGAIDATQLAANAACGSAIGKNTGELVNSTLTVDISCASQGTASIGGIVGTTQGGKVEYVDTFGALTVTGENKTVGLLAGSLTDTPITYCVFVGGDNSLNGQLFTQLASGQTEGNFEGCAFRDNTPVVIPENELKLRQTAVQRMYEITTIQWKVRENLENNEGSFNTKYTYLGMPYRHMGASLARIQYLLDEEGYIKDFAYDIPSTELQNYMGNDCSTALIHALWTVSNSVDFGHCQRQHPLSDGGCLPVGDWAWQEDLGFTDTEPYILATGEQEMYEAYAQMKLGDFYFYMIPELGGHTRMCAENPVVVRNLDGTINPDYSYVISHEQGYTVQDDVNMTFTNCRAGHKYTFANLYYDTSLPVTCEEFITGEMELATAELIGGTDGKLGMITGTVKSNYYLDYVDMVITDEAGNEVLNHRMFPGVGKTGDTSDTTRRFYIDEFDLGRFATVLAGIRFEEGQTYSYTVTATNSPGDTFTVAEGSFVQ